MYRMVEGNHSAGWDLWVPWWFIVIVSLCPCVVWFRRFRRRGELEKRGCCRRCDYDLRAHKVGDRCPECGAAIPKNLVRGAMR